MLIFVDRHCLIWSFNIKISLSIGIPNSSLNYASFLRMGLLVLMGLRDLPRRVSSPGASVPVLRYCMSFIMSTSCYLIFSYSDCKTSFFFTKSFIWSTYIVSSLTSCFRTILGEEIICFSKSFKSGSCLKIIVSHLYCLYAGLNVGCDSLNSSSDSIFLFI